MRFAPEYNLPSRGRAALAFVSLIVLATSAGCRASYDRRDPSAFAERFPSVQGIALDEKAWRLPDDLRELPCVLILAFEQDAQFDIDRWLSEFYHQKFDAPVYEVPTVQGLVPRLISGTINDGMRGGIPEKGWPAVITVYREAEVLAAFTGNTGPNNGRVMVLDQDWKVRFFHDEGFSPEVFDQLRQTVDQLRGEAKEEQQG